MSQDRGDHGSLGEDEKKLVGDRGTPLGGDTGADGRKTPSQIAPSLDMFGNPLMPSASDPIVSGSGSGQDRGSMFEAPSMQQSSTSISTVPSTSATTTKISPITYVIGGIFALVIVGTLAYFGYCGVKTLLASHPSTHTMSLSTATTTTTGTSGDTTSIVSHVTTTTSDLTPNEVFTKCGPSVVTLTIITKAIAVSVDRFELIDPYGEGEPILAALDDNNKPSLYQKGKAVDRALGILKTPKGKLAVMVILLGGTPALYPVNDNLKPIAGKDGKPMRLPVKAGFDKYGSKSTGSGFYVSPDIVATNWHVVSNKAIGDAGFSGGLAQITDKPAKFTITDKPIAFDKEHDLALLYVPGTDAKPVTMEVDYGKLKVGEPVYALGSPLALTGSISEGLISSDKLRGINPADPDSPKLYLQHSAKIDHGNSGGPLLDAKGQVVGVNTAGMGNGAINLAVAAHFVKDLLDKPSTQNKIEKFAKQAQVDLHG